MIGTSMRRSSHLTAPRSHRRRSASTTTIYLECDQIHDGGSGADPEASQVAAARKTLPRKVPLDQEAGSLPRALGPEPDETTTAPTRTLTSPYRPSAAEREAHEGHYRPWCPLRVQARADDDPHCAQEVADENQIPMALFGFFFVGTDELATKCKIGGGYPRQCDKPTMSRSRSFVQYVGFTLRMPRSLV